MSKDATTPAAKTPAQPAQAHSSPAPAVKGKGGHTPLPDGCHSVGCKAKSTRFNFCSEHYEHFKFGLIKKTGEQVSDYEKKFEHYVAYTKRQVQKAA